MMKEDVKKLVSILHCIPSKLEKPLVYTKRKMSSYVPPHKRNTIVTQASGGPALAPVKLTTLQSKPVEKTPSTGYIAPHLRVKAPPKELDASDLNNDALFPTTITASQKTTTTTMDFAAMVKVAKHVPQIPKQRTVLATHPFTKMVVCDMSKAEMLLLKCAEEDETYDIPVLCFDNRLSPLEDDSDDARTEASLWDSESCISEGQWHLYESASEGNPEDIIN